MSNKKIKNLSVQINATAPEELHIVSPKNNHTNKHEHSLQFQEDVEPIQEENANQNQDIHSSPHKIVHIENIEDKGEFTDSQHKIRAVQTQIKQQPNFNYHRNYSKQMELQEICQNKEQESNAKPLKHIKMHQVQDHDEFNLSNSRTKHEKKKRRLSESNLQKYLQHNKNQEIQEQIARLNKSIPFQIIEEEEVKKQNYQKRQRRNSVHSLYKVNGGVSRQFQKMIVDEVDKRKNRSNKKQAQQSQMEMEQIVQEKQQDEQASLIKLGKSIDKMQNQISGLSVVVGGQVGPSNSEGNIGYTNSNIQSQSINEINQTN